MGSAPCLPAEQDHHSTHQREDRQHQPRRAEARAGHANKADEDQINSQHQHARPLFEVHRAILNATSRLSRRDQSGTIAKTRAGNPEPPFGFGKLTITIAPDSGTWSRFASSSI